MRGTLTLEVGVLVKKQVRQTLKNLKFEKYDIDFVENKGLLSSTFKVKGGEKELKALKQVVENYQ
jgi:hypothetical protein